MCTGVEIEGAIQPGMFRQGVVELFYLVLTKGFRQFRISLGLLSVFAMALLCSCLREEGGQFMFPIKGNRHVHLLSEGFFSGRMPLAIPIQFLPIPGIVSFVSGQGFIGALAFDHCFNSGLSHGPVHGVLGKYAGGTHGFILLLQAFHAKGEPIGFC